MSSISEALGPLPSQFSLLYSVVPAVAFPTVAELCGANSLRWGLWISPPLNTSTGAPVSSWLAPNQIFLLNNAGLVLSSTYPNFAVDFRDYGVLAQQAWFGTSLTASAGWHWGVTEILIQQ